MLSQIKSQDRVTELGEVFTNDREINAMLDLVKDESYNIETTFLEPSCGTGNFLVKILERKLQTVKQKYGNDELQYLTNSILALTTIYGIDIMNDNIEESINRLYKLYIKYYKDIFNKNISEKANKTILKILSLNIQQGNTLTGLNNKNEDIIIREWKIENRKVTNIENKFNDLME